jgi:tripartite-type tricarboxylate transporter receptor subunit TctC
MAKIVRLKRVGHAWMRFLAAGIVGAGLAGPAAAQTFPVKPVRLVVGTAAGGASDIVMRLVADKMTGALGQPVIVENRPGASGILAVDAAIKSTPDGYTIAILTSPAIISGLVNGREWKPDEEMSSIGLNYQQGILIGINPTVPMFRDVKNGADLVRTIKANPGKIVYSTIGPASTGHLVALIMSNVAGLQWEHNPYKGGAQMIQDLAAGASPIVVMGPTTQDAASNPGRVLLVATSGAKPQAGVRPLAESGFPSINATTWGGLIGPGRLPAAVHERLAGAYRAAVTSPDYLEKAAKLLDQEYLGPAEFDQMIRSNIAMWRKVIQDNNIKP